MNIVAAGVAPPSSSRRLLSRRRASACAASRPNAPRRRAAATAALALAPYFRELRVVHVMAGDDPLTMLVDTGGGATLITPAVAARHRLPAVRARRRLPDDGRARRIPALRRDGALAGGWRRRVEPVAVFDVNALLPKELPALDGVLALDAFRGDVVTLDWPAAAIIVHGIQGGARLSSAVASRRASPRARPDACSPRSCRWRRTAGASGFCSTPGTSVERSSDPTCRRPAPGHPSPTAG